MMTEPNQQPDGTPTKVRVREPFRIVHDTKEYFVGDVLTAPAHVAQSWLTSGWVEPVTSKAK
jgi:hypothetical protein